MANNIIEEYKSQVSLLNNKEEAYIQLCGKYTTIISELFDRMDIKNPDPETLRLIKKYQENLRVLFNYHFKRTRN